MERDLYEETRFQMHLHSAQKDFIESATDVESALQALKDKISADAAKNELYKKIHSKFQDMQHPARIEKKSEAEPHPSRPRQSTGDIVRLACSKENSREKPSQDSGPVQHNPFGQRLLRPSENSSPS